MSPARSPASFATLPDAKPPISVVNSPNFADGISDRTTASTTARTMFIAGPATATKSSFQAGIFLFAVPSSPLHFSPSSAFVPSGSTSGIET